MQQRVITLRPFQRTPRICWEQRAFRARVTGAWAPPAEGYDLWLDEDEIILDGDNVSIGGALAAPVPVFYDVGFDADEVVLDGNDLQIDQAA